MAKLGIMIEGQEGLNWDRWRKLCTDVEELGFASLRRSDHLVSLMGGVGEKRHLPLVARDADEWNYTRLDHEEYRHKRAVIDEACKAIDRDPSTLRYSVMANFLIGRDREDLRDRASRMAEVLPRFQKESRDDIIRAAEQTAFVGTPEQVAGQIREYAKLGVDLFMLQHLLLDD